MKITLEVSEDNEWTVSPWWAIIDPQQNMSCDINIAASQIIGPFFSRKEAEDLLRSTRYNFRKRACVYCFSGNYSRQYQLAYHAARLKHHKHVEKQINKNAFWFKAIPYKLWTKLRRYL